MSNPIQDAVLDACRKFMRPIVRLLLKNGIGYREFSELCKGIYVDVASSDYGIRGRQTNMSRVAVMTGISRKEVKKIRNAAEVGTIARMPKNRRPELVLSIWHADPEYIDKKNRPKRIRFDGPGPSFRELVSRVRGDIPPRAMLNELIRGGSVLEEGEKLRVVSRSYIPEPHDPQAIVVAGDAIRDLVSTIHYNLGCEDAEMRFFERRVYSQKLPSAQRARFKKLARERGDLLLRDLNSWLSERASAGGTQGADEAEGEPKPRIGVGVYFFDDSTETIGTETKETSSP